MLSNCAGGYEIRDTRHNRRIQYNGVFYPSFPGKQYDDIEIGHIRSLIRTLKIDIECAKQYVPHLSIGEKPHIKVKAKSR